MKIRILFIVLAGALLAACSRGTKAEEAKPHADWQTVEVKGFQFQCPPDFTVREVENSGTDGFCWSPDNVANIEYKVERNVADTLNQAFLDRFVSNLDPDEELVEATMFQGRGYVVVKDLSFDCEPTRTTVFVQHGDKRMRISMFIVTLKKEEFDKYDRMQNDIVLSVRPIEE